MIQTTCLRQGTARLGRQPGSCSLPRRRLRLEPLEDRRLLDSYGIDGVAAAAMAPPDTGGWAPLAQIAPRADLQSYIRAERSAAFTLDDSRIQSLLATAPQETAAVADETTLLLPTPAGSWARFSLVQSPVMAAELAAAFPEIRTYAGRGIDDPAATLRCDFTSAGFHAQVLSPSGNYYIDPYWHLDHSVYVSYFESDLSADPAAIFAQCSSAELSRSTSSDPALGETVASTGVTSAGEDGGVEAAGSSGTVLRTYRLAVAATGEYTVFQGGTQALGQAAIVTAVNRVTGIYEKELSIRLQLVANNQNLVYTNASTDPYTNNNSSSLLTQNQSTIDSVIGDANYDIGHVFSTAGGGLAYVSVVGESGWKAKGETGTSSPVGDAFYVDYVAHEMGHQFGAEHSFNGVNGSAAGNRNAATAYEPGSGSTIMSYAGICGADNLQAHSDPYFHSTSFDEILQYVDLTRPSTGTRTATGNSVPVVEAGSAYTIPASTPFALTAVGSDPNGDSLTYCWEERDLGAAQAVSAADNGSSPILRAWSPSTSPTRVVPRLSDLLANTTSIGEKLPTTSRSLKFRVTVRDNRNGGGGASSDDTTLTVVNTGAAFQVTSPNTAVTWNATTTQTVTWNVAGTTGSGINAATVDILLSVDGGYTYPYVLASGTANDGSQSISLSGVPATTTARIKVQPTANVFFDISNVNFTILATADTKGPSVIAQTWLSAASGLYAVRLRFDEPMDSTSFAAAADVSRFTGPSGNLQSQITGASWTDTTTLEIRFAAQSAPGRYTLVAGPQILDASTNHNAMDQDGNGTSGQTTDSYTATDDLALTPTAYATSMDADPDWTLDAGTSTSRWQWGTPTGEGGEHGNPDPTAGYTGTSVLGYNLSGDYADNIASTQWATTPAFDCSALGQVQLSFYRWLNVEESDYDHVYIQATNNGTSWTTVWENSDLTTDFAWSLQTLDLTSIAAGKSAVRLRWGLGTTDEGWHFSGWNLDDVVVSDPRAHYLPVLESLTGSPNPINRGATLQLVAAGALDPDGQVARVEFYRDTNGNGTLDVGTDALWGTDSDATGGWSLTAATSSLAAGAQTFLARAVDNDLLAGNVVATTVTVIAVPVPPTLTAFAGPIDTIAEDTQVELTFAELCAQGNEADADGSVVAMVVQSVPSGTLNIGASAATATVYAAGTNDVVDASHNAYWTPDANANGSLVALTVQAWDNDGLLSSSAVAAAVNVSPVAEVVGRCVFYNNSAWDGNDPAATSRDYDAIAPAPSVTGHGHAGAADEPEKQLGKQPLLPGQTATFANYTSYAKGINGILIAFDDLADPAAVTAADFAFAVGNDGQPAAWAAAPAPVAIRVEQNVVHASFSGQPDVVTILWADDNPYTSPREAGAVSNEWLQVTALAGAHTGLAAADIFYFGNQIAESGNSSSDSNVDQNDEIGARNHPHTTFNPCTAADPYDINRDGKVDQNDEILARNNAASAFTRISLISVPAARAASLAAADAVLADRSASSATPALRSSSPELAEAIASLSPPVKRRPLLAADAALAEVS